MTERAKIKQTPEELNAGLQDQLVLLKSAADNYDQGSDVHAKYMAVTLRLLLHETKKQHALLGQLGLLNKPFLSTAFPHDVQCHFSQTCLAQIGLGPNTKHLAMLDDVPNKKTIPFEDWWNKEIIICDDKKQTMTRKELVLYMAEQDGGAHVDPAIEEKYSRLSRSNSLGITWTINEENEQPIKSPEKASIRQIAHEVLKTLIPEYTKKPIIGDSKIVFGELQLRMPTDKIPPTTKIISNVKIGRNDPCPCNKKKNIKSAMVNSPLTHLPLCNI